ncbi:unnamed protein product, partial [Heterotrigona itama]
MANNNGVHNTSVRKASFSSSKNESSISAQSNSPSIPILFSPYVVSSRGKSNARKEQQLKRSLSFGRSSNDEDIPTKDTVMKILNISVEEEERTAQYFHFLLNRETDRFVELCKKWTKIQTEPETTEVGQYEISETIEQTNLLINKKFGRFRRLVTDCEVGKGEMLVTCKDLQGFWDMMYMDIKNCDLQFEKLETLRSQDWKEEAVLVNGSFTKKIRNILAKRKKKMAERIRRNKELKSNQHLTSKINNKYQRNISPNIKHKIKSMFIGCSENELIKHRSCLLKNSYPIITNDKVSKTPEVQLDDSISYINSNQTPGRSILKQPKNSTETKCIRSTNKVNFDDHIALNEIPTDEETQIRLNLAAALLRIDNFDHDSFDEVKIGTKRKLFDDSSPNEYEDVKQGSQDNKITSVQAQAAIPLLESNKNFNIPQRRRMKKQNSQDENDMTLHQSMSLNINTSTPIRKDKNILNLNTLLQKHVPISNKNEISSCDESIKVLRNRTIISMGTPINKRKSDKKVYAQKIEYKENESPLEEKTRKNSFKINVNNCEKMDIDENNSSKKRSIRNVEFSENENYEERNRSTLPRTALVKKCKTLTNSYKFIPKENSVSLEMQET